MCRLPWAVGGATHREEKREMSVWGRGVNLHPLGSGLEGGELQGNSNRLCLLE